MISSDFYRKVQGVRTRWSSPENPRGKKGGGGKSSLGRKGSPYFFIPPGEGITLAEVKNSSGIIRRIWMTIHGLCPRILKQARLEIYWDGCYYPAVNVPLGDFFGFGLGRLVAFENALFSSPEGRSMNCFVPMPFKKGMKVRVINDGFTTINMLYYDIDYTIGDELPRDALYFHAWYNQELPTTLRKDYTILDLVKGQGRFLGANFGVFMDKIKYSHSWGGEGEVKFYLDNDSRYPTLCGTGTEDYIGTGWCQGIYNHQYQGCTVADEKRMELCFYRFHIPDPIYFESDIRVTIQQIGSWNRELIQHFIKEEISVFRAGTFSQGFMDSVKSIDPIDFSEDILPDFDLFERSDYWTSCCYFYLDKPENQLHVHKDILERIRSIPDFKEEELYNMDNELPQVRLIKKYIPDFHKLELREIRELAQTLNVILTVLSNQEKALAEEE